MTLIKQVEKFLIESGIEANEAKAEAKLIVTEVSGLTAEDILAGHPLKNEDKIWETAKERAKTKAPIQHILGFAYFMGDKFFVNKDVLIPRPETELLVNLASKEAAETGAMMCAGAGGTVNILDIGTGSGCIGIEISKTLKKIRKNLSVEILGVDISTAALQVAIKNMAALGEERRVLFRKSDIFSSLRAEDKFDIIVSNPPYIPLLAKDGLQDEVKNFDPALALFTKDKDGVEFYERILKDAKKYLKPKGTVLFELGINQAPLVLELGQKYGFKLKSISKDLAGIERVICFKSI